MPLFGGHTLFNLDFRRSDHYYARSYYGEDPTQEENEKVKLEEKQQRAAVQSKRHKKRTVHIPPKKDVPAFLQNFVNKAK